MSTAAAGPDPAKLLAELGELPAERRAERARAVGASGAVLTALADEVEKLAVTEVSRALVASELVLELADSIGGSVERARARRARGQSLAYAGRFDDALGMYREAVRIADEAGAEIEAAHARMSSMHALHNLGRLDESIAATFRRRQLSSRPAKRNSPPRRTPTSAQPTARATIRRPRWSTSTGPGRTSSTNP